MIEFPFHKQDEHMQMFRNAWQLNLAELQAKFILGEKIVFERELWMELWNYVMKLCLLLTCMFLQVPLC